MSNILEKKFVFLFGLLEVLLKMGIDYDSLKNLKEEIKDITEKEELKDIGQGFIYWLLINYFDLDKDEALIALVDGPNDKDIDAFFERDDIIHIIQGKSEKNVGEKEIKTFKGCIDWLKNPEECKKTNNINLITASEVFKKSWEKGTKVELHFFSLGAFNKSANEERKVFNLNPDNLNRIQMFFNDKIDVLRFYNSKKHSENPLAKEKFTFELIKGEYFIREKSKNSIIATIKGKDICELYQKYNDDLFFKNVRYYLGTGRGKIGKVNKSIISTVKFDPENFWYYNNGLSIVCNDFQISTKNPSQTFLEVEGFQIINGCQTTVSIFQAKDQMDQKEQLSDSLHILVRFIKTHDVEDVNNITYNTNSQNPVSERQLKANDPIQRRIQNDFSNYEKPYFYSIKPGDWDTLELSEKQIYRDDGVYRKIDNYNVAQSIYAFNEDPIFARNSRDRLFPDKYEDIFKKEITIQEILLPIRIQNVIVDEISKFSKEFNKLRKDPSSFSDILKAELNRKQFLLYAKLVLLNLVNKLILKKYNEDNISKEIADKLLNNQLEKRISSILNYFITTISFSDIIKNEVNIQMFFKRSDCPKLLWIDIEKEIEKDKPKKNDPLIYLPF